MRAMAFPLAHRGLGARRDRHDRARRRPAYRFGRRSQNDPTRCGQLGLGSQGGPHSQGSTTMATIETDRPGTVQGEVRMLIDGELVEAASGQALRQHQPGHRGGARRGRRRRRRRHAARHRRGAPRLRRDRLVDEPRVPPALPRASCTRRSSSEQEAIRAELVAEVGCADRAHLRPAARRAARGRPRCGRREIIDEFEWERDAARSATRSAAAAARTVVQGGRRASSARSCRGTSRSR